MPPVSTCRVMKRRSRTANCHGQRGYAPGKASTYTYGILPSAGVDVITVFFWFCEDLWVVKIKVLEIIMKAEEGCG